jgi:tRNA1(Val) A37 N6-methylase TrmN6
MCDSCIQHYLDAGYGTTKEQMKRRTELVARIDRVESRRRTAEDHEDAIRVAQLSEQISELAADLAALDAGEGR